MNSNKFNKNHTAVKRLMSELKELQNDSSATDFVVQPLEGNIFEWHFTMRGPTETEFEGGIYHGRITFPAEYPNKPPDIVFLTPNGRFETGQKICLNITSYHKESWNPLWGVRSVMLALISYFPQDAKGIGSIQLPKAAREKLARESKRWRCSTCGSENATALPELSKEEQEAHKKQHAEQQQPIEQVLDAGAVNSLEAPTPKTPAVNAATLFANQTSDEPEIAVAAAQPDDAQPQATAAPSPVEVEQQTTTPQKPAESVAAPAPAVVKRATTRVTRNKPIVQQRSHDHILSKFNGAMTVILLIISALLVNKYIIREPAL